MYIHLHSLAHALVSRFPLQHEFAEPVFLFEIAMDFAVEQQLTDLFGFWHAIFSLANVELHCTNRGKQLCLGLGLG